MSFSDCLHIFWLVTVCKLHRISPVMMLIVVRAHDELILHHCHALQLSMTYSPFEHLIWYNIACLIFRWVWRTLHIARTGYFWIFGFSIDTNLGNWIRPSSTHCICIQLRTNNSTSYFSGREFKEKHAYWVLMEKCTMSIGIPSLPVHGRFKYYLNCDVSSTSVHGTIYKVFPLQFLLRDIWPLPWKHAVRFDSTLGIFWFHLCFPWFVFVSTSFFGLSHSLSLWSVKNYYYLKIPQRNDSGIKASDKLWKGCAAHVPGKVDFVCCKFRPFGQIFQGTSPSNRTQLFEDARIVFYETQQ